VGGGGESVCMLGGWLYDCDGAVDGREELFCLVCDGEDVPVLTLDVFRPNEQKGLL
jgi:hypothetical protein